MRFKNSVSRVIDSVFSWADAHSTVINRCLMIALLATFTLAISAQSTDMTTGVSALGEVSNSLKQYVQPVRVLCYALAGIIAIGGAISVYIKMNNEEQDVKKSVMMIVGACIFLIAAATFLPKFFGM